MRTATSKMDFVVDENNVVKGIALGYDFCAEHEDGTRNLNHLLGVSYVSHSGWKSYESWQKESEGVELGLISRKMTKLPSENKFSLIEFYDKHHFWSGEKTDF